MSVNTYTRRETDFLSRLQRHLQQGQPPATLPFKKKKEKRIVKLCKSYVVFNVSKCVIKADGSLDTKNVVNGNAYSMNYHTTLESAQTAADNLARGGTVGIIFEAKEFRQIQPAPVVVERVSCCD